MAEEYTYQPLDNSKHEIRLLNLVRRDGCGDEIFCELNTVPLADVVETYIALSYTWGTSSNTKPIRILNSGKIFVSQVQENLFDALLALRLKNMERLLWVDAVCINQKDYVEKSHQVQQMRDIYRTAIGTAVWLGKHADASEVAFQDMEALDEKYSKPIQKTEWGAIRSELNVENEEDGLLHPEAMSALLRRLWFTRVWILQEISVAKDVRFFCGDSIGTERAMNIAVNVFMHLQDTISRIGPEERTEYQSRFIKNLSTRAAKVADSLPSSSLGKSMTLWQLMEAIYPTSIAGDVTSRAKDPRDLIYALLGIASDAEELGIEIDYFKSVQEVFTETAAAILRTGRIEVLTYAQQPQMILNLPSWVPDWASHIESFLQGFKNSEQTDSPVQMGDPHSNDEIFRLYSASGNTAPSIDFSNNSNRVISFKCFLLDTIAEVGGTVRDRRALLSLQDIAELFFTIRKLIEDNGKKIYTMAALKEEAVFRTMVTDRFVVPASPRPVCRVRPQHWATTRRAIFEIAKLGPYENLSTTLIDDVYLGPNYGVSVRTLVTGFRPFITGKGHIGMGPKTLEEGDVIMVPLGSKVPYAVRKREEGGYRLVGEAYTHGIMDGEILEMDCPVEMVELH